MRYLGSRDDPLTAHGSWQAAQLSRPLALVSLDSIYASPMRRTMETAAPIARACGIDLHPDVRLREEDFGRWEGLTRAEVEALGPEDARLLKEWEADSSAAPPGGEALESVRSRTLELVKELAERYSGGRVALVSHVGPIKSILAEVLGAGLQSTRRMFLDPATISVVDWGTFPVLRLFNSHEHLGWKSARWF